MKKLLATLLLIPLLIASLAFVTVPLAFAVSDSSSFDVFEILNVGEGDSSTGETTLSEEIYDEYDQSKTESVAEGIILRAINILILVLGTFGFVMIVIGGFMLATAGGDETQIDRGKSILTQTVFGMVIAFLSYFIVTFILSFFY